MLKHEQNKPLFFTREDGRLATTEELRQITHEHPSSTNISVNALPGSEELTISPSTRSALEFLQKIPRTNRDN